MIYIETFEQSIMQSDGTGYKGQILLGTGLVVGEGKLVFKGDISNPYLFHRATATGHFEGNRLVDGTVVYDTGATYQGPLDSYNRTSGHGHWTSPNGDSFDGEFLEGFPVRGVAKFHDGSSITGWWIKGVLQGDVTYVRPDNSTYRGKWSGDHAEGPGTWTTKDGIQYSGTWHAGALQPAGGTVHEPGGRTYEYAPHEHDNDTHGTINGKDVSFPKEDVYGAGK
jgi:hypothetical protein